MLAPAATAPPAPPPARILVFADEFRFNLSRARITAGRLVLQLKNIGEDDHDLRIIGPRGTIRAETGAVRPDGLRTLRTTLARGRYTYVCTVADHQARGMTGTFRVVGRRRAAR